MDMLEPGKFGHQVAFKKRYGNFINGEWVAPAKGQYFDNITPVTGKPSPSTLRKRASELGNSHEKRFV